MFETDQTDCLAVLLPLLEDPKIPPHVRFLLRQLEAHIEEYMLMNFPDLDPRSRDAYLNQQVVAEVQRELLQGFQNLMLDRMLNILPLHPEMKLVTKRFLNVFGMNLSSSEKLFLNMRTYFKD